jgi:hypothetical protein
MGIMQAISSLLLILAYFFNPKLREQQEKEKIWSIFHDLEERLAQALVNKDMYTVDKIRHWLQEMRDKYAYLKEGNK